MAGKPSLPTRRGSGGLGCEADRALPSKSERLREPLSGTGSSESVRLREPPSGNWKLDVDRPRRRPRQPVRKIY